MDKLTINRIKKYFIFFLKNEQKYFFFFNMKFFIYFKLFKKK